MADVDNLFFGLEPLFRKHTHKGEQDSTLERIREEHGWWGVRGAFAIVFLLSILERKKMKMKMQMKKKTDG